MTVGVSSRRQRSGLSLRKNIHQYTIPMPYSFLRVWDCKPLVSTPFPDSLKSVVREGRGRRVFQTSGSKGRGQESSSVTWFGKVKK